MGARKLPENAWNAHSFVVNQIASNPLKACIVAICAQKFKIHFWKHPKNARGFLNFRKVGKDCIVSHPHLRPHSPAPVRPLTGEDPRKKKPANKR
jgi:hypothetical protein